MRIPFVALALTLTAGLSDWPYPTLAAPGPSPDRSTAMAAHTAPRPNDFTGTGRSSLAVYRPATGVWSIEGSADLQFGLPGDLPVPLDYDGDGRSEIALYRPASGMWYIRGVRTAQWGGLPGDAPVPGDYNGDGRADLAVFRTLGTWYGVWHFENRAAVLFGQSGDVPVPGDYDGDGITDVAVFRPSDGRWLVGAAANNFSLSSVHQFFTTDIPVPAPGDYDGDGRIDPAVFRRQSHTWIVLLSSTGTNVTIASGDRADHPLGLDLSGDGVDELCTFSPSNGLWTAYNRITGATTQTTFGGLGDRPAAYLPQGPRTSSADFDGDGADDLTVWRPSSGMWYTLESSTGYGTSVAIQWGLPGDIKVPGDYDGDRRSDPAVWRPDTGMWYVRFSHAGYTTTRAEQWGLPGDVPVPADYDGDGRTDLAVYRPSDRSWYVRYSSTDFTTSSVTHWGEADDVPLPADYDGDGLADCAVLRPSANDVHIRLSSGVFNGVSVKHFGQPGDTYATSDYNRRAYLIAVRDRTSPFYGFELYFGDPLGNENSSSPNGEYRRDPGDLVVWNEGGLRVLNPRLFRPSDGTWYFNYWGPSFQWGLPGDEPIGRIR